MSSHETKSLTVVIPAYDVGTYIGACLLSVLNQPCQERALDIVIVVDGATDNTLDEIYRVTSGRNGNVRVILQDNAGLSAARDTGLNATVTDYVAFLDGDDIWLPNYLVTVLATIESERPDIVEYDAIRLNESGEDLGTLKIAAAPTGGRTAGSQEAFLTKFLCFAWARVYRTSLVRSHLFPPGRRFEDTATTPWHYWNSTRITSLGKPLIGYRQRANSILSTPTLKDIDDIASTTAEAAAMYANTGTEYWQRVTHRSFQQACSRIAQQPMRIWPSSLRSSYAAVGGVPAPPGAARWLQANYPLLYVALLRVKRAFRRKEQGLIQR